MMSADLHLRSWKEQFVIVRDFPNQNDARPFTSIRVANGEGEMNLYFDGPEAVKAFATEILGQVHKIESPAPELMAAV